MQMCEIKVKGSGERHLPLMVLEGSSFLDVFNFTLLKPVQSPKPGRWPLSPEVVLPRLVPNSCLLAFYKNTCDCFVSTQIIQDNLAILRALITTAKSLWLYGSIHSCQGLRPGYLLGNHYAASREFALNSATCTTTHYYQHTAIKEMAAEAH